ncbi:MAG TPA: hypothetical protein VMT89_14995, partial [Candidatus Acidoferrales bacterium]|nr:hypothetical protein [Candidatus Acidoferrales bacterium]
MIRQVRTGWQLLSSRDRSRWLSTVPLAASSAVLEAVGAAAVYGLIRLIGDPTQIARVPILARAAAWLPWKNPHVVVLAATVVVAVLYLVKNVTMSVLAWTVSKASAESWSSLSQRLLRGY